MRKEIEDVEGDSALLCCAAEALTEGGVGWCGALFFAIVNDVCLSIWYCWEGDKSNFCIPWMKSRSVYHG